MRGRYFKVGAILVAILIICGLGYFAHHTRVESFSYIWHPGDSYAPARQWPNKDVAGQPKVVLARTLDSLECYEICYSRELELLVQRNPGAPVKATYRVSIQFGRPYWIETVETGEISNLMCTSGQVGRGECF